MVKILVDARTLGSRPSGVGIYLYNFILGLRKDRELQFELATDVIESAELQELATLCLPIHTYGTKVQKNIKVYAYFQFIQKKIHELKPDLFWEGNNLIPVRLKNPYGKIVVTIHDIFPVTVPACYSKIYQYYFRWNLKKTIRFTDAVLYDSEYAKNELENYNPKAQNITSFVSYIVVDGFPECEVSSGKYFLYIGNIEERKGTDLLLKAYCRYRKEGGDKELYLGGKIRSEEIKELLTDCQKEVDGIHYIGYVDTQKKFQLYAECASFVFPSRGEGFGMPVIEALNYGKAVIVSNLEIFKEIAGDAVRYFELSESEGDTVDRLVKALFETQQPDPKKCRETVQRYAAGYLSEQLGIFMKSLAEG